ncbi:MAG: ferredoxin Fer [Haloarculaceae archaeon]
MESPFEVLGVEPGADPDEIKAAYRRRVKEAHPDQGGSVREFRRVRAAYDEITADSAEDALPGGVDGADGGPPGATGGVDSGPDPDVPGEFRETRVEYLDYEVVHEYGWDVDDPDLFGKAAAADLDAADYGEFRAEPRESLLEAAERHDFAWPFACRGGACANCAVLVLEGDLSTPVNHVLPQEVVDRGIELSCNGVPTTDELKVVYNVKHMPDLEDLLLPPRPFEQAHLD